MVGDLWLDQALIGRVTGLAPGAPVPILAVERQVDVPGGAARVAGAVRALGAAVTLVGVTGDDATALDLRGLLEARGVQANGLIVDPSRPTTRQTRLLTLRQQLVTRFDVGTTADVSDDVEAAIVARLADAMTGADAVVVCDAVKGVVTCRVMAHVVADAHARGKPVLVDPSAPHMARYAGATLLTPDHEQASRAHLVDIRAPDDARRAARALRESLRVDGVLVRWPGHGVWLSDQWHDGHVPAVASEAPHVAGADSTTVAALTAAMAAGATPAEAARLARAAADLAAPAFDAPMVTADELRARVARAGLSAGNDGDR